MATAAALSSNALVLEKLRFETFFIDDTVSLRHLCQFVIFRHNESRVQSLYY